MAQMLLTCSKIMFLTSVDQDQVCFSQGFVMSESVFPQHVVHHCDPDVVVQGKAVEDNLVTISSFAAHVPTKVIESCVLNVNLASKL